MRSPAERLMSAADVLDKAAAAEPAPMDLRPHVASVLLLRGLRLAPFSLEAQESLCSRDPSRELLTIADLVLAGAA